ARTSPSALSAKREIMKVILPDSKGFAAAAAVRTRTSALPAQRETTRLALALPSENDSWRAFGFFHKILSLLLLLIISTSIAPVSAQDARELEQERTASSKLKGEHPLVDLMRTRKSALRPELMGVHPRVYVTDKELADLRARARTSHRELWQQAISQVRALAGDPPTPPAEQRRQQNDVGIAIAESAFIYKIEGDKKYLDAARKYMDAAASYDIWGYASNKPNVDLAAGH